MMTDHETSGFVYVKPENDDGDENSYYEND